MLDGWRGISILLVLAAHLLPLGPKAWSLNATAGPMGMALFFVLSGFLITRFLLAESGVAAFLIRRVCRIVPLAWLTMLIAFPLTNVALRDYGPNLLFYANLPPQHLTAAGGHLWSLCVEMQFYVGIAIVVAVFGLRGLHAIPVLCIAVTLHRVLEGAYVDVVTWRRADEILAGALLALVHAGFWGRRHAMVMSRTNVFVLFLLFAVSSHPSSGFMNYFRPYLAAALVGRTLFPLPPPVSAVLFSPSLRYLAAISYALYVIHGVLVHTWLASGDTLVKYIKRPLLLLATFALAHFSTFYFERRWIELGRRWSSRYQSAQASRMQ